MKKTAKKTLAILFSCLGYALAIFVGGYVLFLRPVFLLFTGFTAGTLTKTLLVRCVIEVFIASTVGGAIWCIFDIIAGLFRDYPEDI
ncbi:MAG: hypothetical protein HUJ71_04210 [Pseudobutyrivibrio sp.]|nr:hypothetical protein [Pseudobutyrivibrio sp.]